MYGPIPTFETKRLILKPVTMEMAADYKKHFVDYEIIRELAAAVPWPYPDDGVETFLRSSIIPEQGKSRWMWGICLKSKPDEVIGAVDLWREGRPENRGFWLGRRFWDQGLMTEAVQPVMDYAFENLGFEKLVFTNAKGNQRSRRVKEKTGARLLDVRPMKFVDPKYTEHEVWELKKEDWLTLKKGG